MSKIQTIKLTNFKAIDKIEADFKGCTAIVTAGNNKGKSSLLRGIADRIRFVRPEVMVKAGEKEGSGEMVLTTGEKFIWEFNTDGKDKLTYVTASGSKQNVTVALGKEYFPEIFDIDKFLQSSPKEQAKQLQKIIGLDFSEIDAKYQKAYDDRTEKNREAERYHVKLTAMLKVDEVKPVDLTDLQNKKQAEKDRLNTLYLKNKSDNDKLRESWNREKDVVNEDCRKFNKIQTDRFEDIKRMQAYRDRIISILSEAEGLVNLVDLTKLNEKITSLPKPETLKIAENLYPKEPTYINEMPDSATLDAIDEEILKASETNASAAEYKKYIDQKKATDAAQVEAKEADELVKSIEDERQKMIESAKMPAGISITPEGITVDGFPLDKNQISTSKLYCSALKIASINLGEVKTLYFDASFLDRNTLAEIQSWAQDHDLQLLIERPDFDGGEIRYELTEN